MHVAWTTTADRTEAEKLARGAVDALLAVCTQIDPPHTSFYRWEGKTERSDEHRVWFKFLPARASELSAWVHHHHSYKTPQWIEISAETVGEKYLSWAMANSTPRPFPSTNSP